MKKQITNEEIYYQINEVWWRCCVLCEENFLRVVKFDKWLVHVYI